MPRIQRTVKSRARKLRSNPTEAERKLWAKLRERQLQGLRFRRQHPIPPFVADFACVEAKLIVEVDGGQHAESRADARRTTYVNEQGWRVLRFWNNEVLENMDGVLQRIVAVCPHPSGTAALGPSSAASGTGGPVPDRSDPPPPSRGRE